VAELPVPDHSAAEARRRAEEILSSPEFRAPEPSLLERVRDWLLERFADLLRTLAGSGAGTVVAWVILGALVAVLVVLVARVGHTVRRDPAGGVDAVVERRRPAVEWLAEAERFEAAGDWKRALRCRYRALLADLVRHGVVRDVPGRTTGEYRREVQARLPAAGGEFAGASELFERAWYGDLPTGPEEAERFRVLADAVVRSVAR
jgi:hypothetical protein